MEPKEINYHLDRAEHTLKKVLTYAGCALGGIVGILLFTTPLISSILLFAFFGVCASERDDNDPIIKYTYPLAEKYPVLYGTLAVTIWCLHLLFQIWIGCWWWIW